MNYSSSPNRAKSIEASGLASPWSPLRLRVFRNLWVATLVSNIGTWMHDVGAGWLMTTFTTSPAMVALVQAATTLPIFLLAIPAGALSDIFDRRRYLIGTLLWMMAVAAVLGLLTIAGLTNAWSLLALTLGLGAGTAFMLPAMAAVVPELVPREELHGAIALNVMGINISRAIGPVLAGVIISVTGCEVVFIINAVTFLAVVAVLWRWRRNSLTTGVPVEQLADAIGAGVRFAVHSRALQATMVRGVGFILFAIVLWALLPLIAKELLGGGPETYGILVGSIGIGAVIGALILPWLRRRVSIDHVIAGATVQYAVAVLITGYLHQLVMASVAMAMCGAAWIAAISSLQVAAQMSLPNWVRGRGLSVVIAVQMGAMAAGSILWGLVAKGAGIRTAGPVRNFV
ncbi:MAG: MFS transporter [Gammaproteobacteria bacterium]|nr:MAG: MFS transporter [Gammaproteobacteria bacterium]